MADLACGHPDDDPTVSHPQHEDGCWLCDGSMFGCSCPNVCSKCCETCNKEKET